MDDTLDALARAVVAESSRRGVLVRLGSAMLAALSFASSGDAAANKHHKRKSKRRKRRNQESLPPPLPLPPPSPPPEPPPPCVGNCTGKRCGDDGCGVSCGTCSGGAVCQGGECSCPNGRVRCAGNCCDRGQICVAGTCRTGQGTCATGADSCIADTIFCDLNPTCVCFQSTEGTTRCGQPHIPETMCGNCTSSASCAADFPGTPGIFCAVDTTGPAGCGCNPGDRTCVPPCPN